MIDELRRCSLYCKYQLIPLLVNARDRCETTRENRVSKRDSPDKLRYREQKGQKSPNEPRFGQTWLPWPPGT